jgi:hypothetical protein
MTITGFLVIPTATTAIALQKAKEKGSFPKERA